VRCNKGSRQVSQKVNNIGLGEGWLGGEHSSYCKERIIMQTLTRGMEREGGCLVIYPERRMGISGRSILRPNGDSGGDKLGQ